MGVYYEVESFSRCSWEAMSGLIRQVYKGEKNIQNEVSKCSMTEIWSKDEADDKH